MDIWSLGMTLFCLLNPDMKYPYQTELKRDKGAGMTNIDFLKQLHTRSTIPEHSVKYATQRSCQWMKISKAFEICSKFHRRPSAKNVYELLQADKPNSSEWYYYYDFFNYLLIAFFIIFTQYCLYFFH